MAYVLRVIAYHSPIYDYLCLLLMTKLPLQALPESLTGSDKSKGFRSILLNTCQDQFEEAANNRAVSHISKAFVEILNEYTSQCNNLVAIQLTISFLYIIKLVKACAQEEVRIVTQEGDWA